MSSSPFRPCFRCSNHVDRMQNNYEDDINSYLQIIKNLRKDIKKLELDIEFSKLYLDNKNLIFEAMEAYTSDDKEKYNQIHDLYHKLGGLY